MKRAGTEVEYEKNIKRNHSGVYIMQNALKRFTSLWPLRLFCSVTDRSNRDVTVTGGTF